MRPRPKESGADPLLPVPLAPTLSPITWWTGSIASRGTPKCATDEAFIETATFLISLVLQPEGRVVRWEATREAIV